MDIWIYGSSVGAARQNVGGATECGRRERMRAARKNAGGPAARQNVDPATMNSGGGEGGVGDI